MTERTHAEVPRAEIAAPADHRAGDHPGAGAAARMLALQRTAGNAAVGLLLRQATATPTATNARQWLEEEVRERWGVAVRVGTEADQVAEMRRITPSAQPSPSSIAGWQAWDPAANSDLYGDIVAGFDRMGFVLGGIPAVSELRFLATEYDNAGGTAADRPDVGATYSAGLLNVFRGLQTANWPLPTGRSTAQVRAPITTGARSESRRRIIIHELCHGVFELGGTPGGPAYEPNFFADWGRAAGWSSGQIIQSGTVLDTANWNESWPEQPVSAYSLQNPMEDFCESLMCYIDRKRVLEERSPARYAFIDSRITTWRPHLRRPIGHEYPPGDYTLPSGDTRYA